MSKQKLWRIKQGYDGIHKENVRWEPGHRLVSRINFDSGYLAACMAAGSSCTGGILFKDCAGGKGEAGREIGDVELEQAKRSDRLSGLWDKCIRRRKEAAADLKRDGLCADRAVQRKDLLLSGQRIPEGEGKDTVHEI